MRLQRGVDRFFGPRLEYNTREDRGVFESPQYLLQRERVARGGAEELEILGRDRLRMKNATFTTCEPGRDDWVLEASEIDLDYETEEGRARNPRLRFYDVPVFGFPFVSFPLENRRRSGLLTPYYSQTTQRGLEVGVPYYFNIAPERDATLTPVYMAKRGVQLKSQARYLERDYSGELRLEYLPEIRNRTGRAAGSHCSTRIPFCPTSPDSSITTGFRTTATSPTSRARCARVDRQPAADGYVTYNGHFGAYPYTAQARVQKFQTLQARWRRS